MRRDLIDYKKTVFAWFPTLVKVFNFRTDKSFMSVVWLEKYTLKCRYTPTGEACLDRVLYINT